MIATMVTVVEAVRSLVRPAAVYGVIGVTLGLAAAGRLEEAKFTAAFGGPIVGWWFLERREQHREER